jgi:hypothetical protein
MKTLKKCNNCKVEYLATKSQKFCSAYCKTKNYRDLRKIDREKEEAKSLPKITQLSLGINEALSLMKGLGNNQNMIVTKKEGRWIVDIK